MIKSYATVAVILLYTLITACSEEESKPAVEATNVSTAGGQLKSDDNKIAVAIPAGAVAKNVAIEIEELTNDVSNGIGKIYRLTAQEFLKPVTLKLTYNEEEINTKGTYPALLQLVTRKTSADAWEVVNDFTIDTANKVLQAEVDHFSDWTIVSTEGTLQFTLDGATYQNLNLSVTMGTKLGKPAKFYAFNDDKFFRATVDSTIMGASYATLSVYLGKISELTTSIADTTNVLLVEPGIKSGCYTHGDGSAKLRFESYSTTAGKLITGTFTVPGVAPTDNAVCQSKKPITGKFAYIVK